MQHPKAAGLRPRSRKRPTGSPARHWLSISGCGRATPDHFEACSNPPPVPESSRRVRGSMTRRRSGSRNMRWSSLRSGPKTCSSACSEASSLTKKTTCRSAAQPIAARSTAPPLAMMATTATIAMAPTRLAEGASGPTRLIAVQPGLAFDQTTPRRRSIGAIRAEAASAGLQADWDSCWLDDTPLTSLDDWRHAIASERLADVAGSFVIAWRDAAGATHLARDGVGGRSMFYGASDDGLAFAGALPDLLANVAIPRRLNLPAVARYLATAYVPGRETLVENVFEVLPGE